MIQDILTSLNFIINQTITNLNVLLVILAVPWAVFFLSRFVNRHVLLLGIIPRHVQGIPGILFAPLLHANFNHLFFNSVPLVVLSNFILINGLGYYLRVTLIITLLSGTAIWCFAKPGLHIGASALITGYWSFLVVNGYHNATSTTIILALISVYYFIGLFTGIFPSQKGVSWEGHLFGLLAGVGASYMT